MTVSASATAAKAIAKTPPSDTDTVASTVTAPGKPISPSGERRRRCTADELDATTVHTRRSYPTVPLRAKGAQCVRASAGEHGRAAAHPCSVSLLAGSLMGVL